MIKSPSPEPERRGFCIYLNTFFQGPTVAVRDGENCPVVFATKREAELEIVDHLQTRLQEFIDGERDFEDATSVEEYVVPVTAFASGEVKDDDGRIFNNED